jgi:hypothetical protein
MSCKEVVTFWLDMGARISLLSRVVAALREDGRIRRQVSREAMRATR